MDPQLVQAINFGFLVAYIALSVAALTRMIFRAGEYWYNNLPIPPILIRDILFFTGLAVPFLGVIYFRVADIVARNEPWYAIWSIGSGGAAIIGVLYWVYYEYFKVEKK